MTEPGRAWDKQTLRNAALDVEYRLDLEDSDEGSEARRELIADALQAAYDAGQAAGAENERRRVFDMMAADIRTVTGLDWSPTEGRTLQWLLDQHKAAGVAQMKAALLHADALAAAWLTYKDAQIAWDNLPKGSSPVEIRIETATRLTWATERMDAAHDAFLVALRRKGQ